jgi:hypothetical protein
MTEPTQPSQPDQLSKFNQLSTEDQKVRWELYGEHKKQTWQDIQSSTDSYDQSLLTLSSGGLGLSIAFIKDIIPLHQAVWLIFLYVSWALFGLTILLTVTSFIFSVEAQKRSLKFLWNFYIEVDDSFRDMESRYSKALRWCTVVGGIFFFGAVFCTVIFAIQNVTRYSKMSDPTKTSRFMEGRNTLSMTPVPQTTVQVKQDQVTVTLGSSQSNTTPPCDSGTSSTSKQQSKP